MLVFPCLMLFLLKYYLLLVKEVNYSLLHLHFISLDLYIEVLFALLSCVSVYVQIVFVCDGLECI